MARRARASETARIEAFSDGVFAIAITLLVIELRVPGRHHTLWHGLVSDWPQFAAYLTSFFIIGIMWVNHHSLFREIVRADRTLLFLNLLLLLWTALLPFPTALVSDYLGHGGGDAAVAEAVYSANLTLAAIAFSLIWLHAVRRGRLIAHPMSPRDEWRAIGRFSVGTFVYAAAIGVSFAAPGAALAVQFVLALYYLFEQVTSTPAPAVPAAQRPSTASASPASGRSASASPSAASSAEPPPHSRPISLPHRK